MNIFIRPQIDYVREINAARRRHALARQFAWLLVMMAAMMLAVAVGCLFSLVGSLTLSLLALAIIFIGLIAAHYLLTRH